MPAQLRHLPPRADLPDARLVVSTPAVTSQRPSRLKATWRTSAPWRSSARTSPRSHPEDAHDAGVVARPLGDRCDVAARAPLHGDDLVEERLRAAPAPCDGLAERRSQTDTGPAAVAAIARRPSGLKLAAAKTPGPGAAPRRAARPTRSRPTPRSCRSSRTSARASSARRGRGREPSGERVALAARAGAVDARHEAPAAGVPDVDGVVGRQAERHRAAAVALTEIARASADGPRIVARTRPVRASTTCGPPARHRHRHRQTPVGQERGIGRVESGRPRLRSRRRERAS